MKTFEQLWNEGKELEQQFSRLKFSVQNPGATYEDYMHFLSKANNFESSYQEWILQMTITLSAVVSESEDEKDDTE